MPSSIVVSVRFEYKQRVFFFDSLYPCVFASRITNENEQKRVTTTKKKNIIFITVHFRIDVGPDSTRMYTYATVLMTLFVLLFFFSFLFYLFISYNVNCLYNNKNFVLCIMKWIFVGLGWAVGIYLNTMIKCSNVHIAWNKLNWEKEKNCFLSLT